MKSTAPNSDRDEIEVLDGDSVFQGRRYGRIRVREGVIGTKASIFLSPDQLDEFATQCQDLAAKLRSLPIAGDPGHRSPAAIDQDPAYSVESGFDGMRSWPHTTQHVVRHKQSGTYWSCQFATRTDDSDYEVPTKWKQVQRKTVQVVRFEETSA